MFTKMNRVLKEMNHFTVYEHKEKKQKLTLETLESLKFWHFGLKKMI